MTDSLLRDLSRPVQHNRQRRRRRLFDDAVYEESLTVGTRRVMARVRLRAFPNVKDGRQQVSAAGGLHPRWSADGRELFYIAGDGTMTSVPVQSGSTLVLGRPVPLFNAGQYHVNVARNYDVTADGKRFVMVRNADQSPRASMIVVTRWFDELRAKIAPKR